MVDLSEQRRRAAKNQSLAREVNERIEDLATSAAFPAFFCECAELSCTEMLPVTLEEYERVRGASNSFVVAIGHELPDIERVIDATDRYLIVAKLAPGDAVAEELDPRRGQSEAT